MRVLFSGGGGPGYTPLYINGTNAADTILVSQNENVITYVVNGVTNTRIAHGLIYGSSPDEVIGQYGVSQIVISGMEGDDTIKGDPSVMRPMTIRGGRGSDHIVGGYRADTIYGGYDGTLTSGVAEWGGDTIDGGNGDDLIVGALHGASRIYGNLGDDHIICGDASDTAFGSLGNDHIEGNDGYDWIWGDGGLDTIEGGIGIDHLYGGTDADYMEGGMNSDFFWGQDGDDVMVADHGSDEYHGGDGIDTVSYKDRTENLVITQDDFANDGKAGEEDNVFADVEAIWGGKGNDKIFGGAVANQLFGEAGNDELHGGGGGDKLFGWWGRDKLYGDGGDDQLFGESGHDSIWGGMGADELRGGDGDDQLVAIGGGASDKVFGEAGNDSLWLDNSSTELNDGDGTESSNGHLHFVGSFKFGWNKDPLGQNLPDPGVTEGVTYDLINRDRFDNNPLFDPADTAPTPMRSDVNQGKIGDCWFLADLASIAAAKPDKIRQSVVDLGDGSFAVRFVRDGHVEYYRVDSELPAKSLYNGYTYAAGVAYADLGPNGAMWVAIMEKAFVFYEGGSDANYDDIAGGWADDGYDALGLSNYTYDVDNDNAINVVKNALSNGQAVSVNTSWSLDGFDLGDSIVLNHVYSVVNVSTTNHTITLYNPWGTDAGSGSGAWVQGDNDGYVTFTWDSFTDYTRDFYIATL
jgi:Ca2+-binding RTX toxin-like protein